MARQQVALSALVIVTLLGSATAQMSVYDQNIVALANFLVNTTQYSDFGNMLLKNYNRAFVQQYTQQALTALIPTNTAAQLFRSYGVLQYAEVITYHLIPGLIPYYNLRPSTANANYPTIQGAKLIKLSPSFAQPVISGSNTGSLRKATVIKGDLYIAPTVVAHGIDTLLQPPGLT